VVFVSWQSAIGITTNFIDIVGAA